MCVCTSEWLPEDVRAGSAAPKAAMEAAVAFIAARHGSVDGYLDSIGFTPQWRDRLRRAMRKA